ncbi:MAG: hypothetical protein HY548_06140 [Elusimicrobia bacterium]|nr:hypothetical protein [Elusimicrobiota bacterium]
MSKTTALFFFLFFCASFCCPTRTPAAPASKDKFFLAEKGEVLALVQERVRAAHHDYQRALKTGESRLRQLHDNYMVQGSTPPTVLDQDLQELRSSSQVVRLKRSRGQTLPQDPNAKRLIERYWETYALEYEKLLDNVSLHRRLETPESQVYWDIMKKYWRLRGDTEERLVFNTPASETSLDDVLSRNEWKLLKAVESRGKKTRGAGACVTVPEEHPRQVIVEPAPFYHSQGLLPTVSPARIGAFSVPPGCRTVTKYESGEKTIFRVSRGRGVAYIGTTEKDLHYGYLAVPSDTPFYFENTTQQPLELEYIVLPN